MFGIVSSIAIPTAYAVLKERNDFYERANKLPKKERDRLIAARKKRLKEVETHRKALEIANASRARNFWGD